MIFAAALLTLNSCQSLKEEFQPVWGGYDNPEEEVPVTMNATHTIGELAAMYETGNPWTIDQNIVISGIVSTTDRYGNFYKSFYIQDETGGMEIKLGKNGLYNDYLPGQRVYVNCRDLELGMYGYKSGSGNGMVQIGFHDPSETYETSYLESSMLIDTHVFKGEIEGEVEPVVVDAADLPGANDNQDSCPYLGKLVTIKNLWYSWYDSKYKASFTSFLYRSISRHYDDLFRAAVSAKRNPGCFVESFDQLNSNSEYEEEGDTAGNAALSVMCEEFNMVELRSLVDKLGLSGQERVVINLLMEGQEKPDIARRMGVQTPSVHKYVKRIGNKINLSGAYA